MEEREERTRQTARLTPLLGCQNRHKANRNAQECMSFWPFCLCMLYFLLVLFFWHPSFTSFPPQTLVINLKRPWDVKHRPTTSTGGHKIHFYSVLFYFHDLTWPIWWLECVAMGMGGAWVEERDHIEERSKLSTPGTTRLWSKTVWFMAYGLPHWGETVQFPHEDTADEVASSHASSCSVKVLHQKYRRYFLGVGIFRDTLQCLAQSKQKAKGQFMNL